MNELKTSLYLEHINLGAKMSLFANYMMPISYKKGLKFEYNAVRNDVGMFDVSHMGQIYVKGVDAINYLQYITTNNINKISDFTAQYSAICNDAGGIIDDIIVYKYRSDFFLIIVNASDILDKFNWFLNKSANFKVTVSNESNKFSIIALQGPKSREILSKIIDKEIKLNFYTFEEFDFNSLKLIVSRTGYTGELGFELIGSHKLIKYLWMQLLDNFVSPCGLGVRDILRMEMKYCLYGNDISLDTNPIEAGLSWIVDLSKNNFIGKDSIYSVDKVGPLKKLICFIMDDRAIPRKDYNIIFNNEIIGITTSGIFSPGLGKGIGLGYIKSDMLTKNKDNLFLEVRDKLYKIKIIKPPFLKNTSLHN